MSQDRNAGEEHEISRIDKRAETKVKYLFYSLPGKAKPATENMWTDKSLMR